MVPGGVGAALGGPTVCWLAELSCRVAVCVGGVESWAQGEGTAPAAPEASPHPRPDRSPWLTALAPAGSTNANSALCAAKAWRPLRCAVKVPPASHAEDGGPAQAERRAGAGAPRGPNPARPPVCELHVHPDCVPFACSDCRQCHQDGHLDAVSARYPGRGGGELGWGAR